MPLVDASVTMTQVIQESDELAFAMISSALEELIEGDAATSRILLRNVTRATIGFEVLANVTNISQTCLVEMLSVNGNPSMNELSSIMKAVHTHLKEKGNVERPS